MEREVLEVEPAEEMGLVTELAQEADMVLEVAEVLVVELAIR